MSQVEFTPRAEKTLSDLLDHQTAEETLLEVRVGGDDVELIVKDNEEMPRLQSDVDVIGPFRVPIGEREVSMFVRDDQPRGDGLYKLDYLAVGGKNCYRIQDRSS